MNAVRMKITNAQPVKMTVKEASVVPGGDMSFPIDNETLIVKNGVLCVNTINDVQQDNTLPITSAAVYATVGNISAILDTI